MRKIFTFLFAALMSVGMFATTVVTITQNDFPQRGNSFTKDGVTVSAVRIDGMDGNILGPGSFSTTLGNFTQIEVSANYVGSLGESWSGDSEKKTWTGNASSVSFSGEIMGMGMGVTFKFTIEEPTVAVTGVTLNQNEAQMTVGGETLTLTATVNPNNATDQSVSWSTSDANVATVENGVVTAVAAGTATITVTTTDGNKTATCAVTVTAPEPQPATTYTVTFTNFISGVKVEENITLPHTFSCDYTNGNGELDLIIQELYNETGGHCSTSSWPWGGNENEVVVGHDGNNHFVTINAPFVGTSFMSGYYDGINVANFYYSFHITIAAAESEPERELTKVGFHFPELNQPADNNIEMVGSFEEGAMDMEKIIATGWFLSYGFVHAAADETFKFRDKTNNDLVLCKKVGDNWVQAIFTFGDLWAEDTWKGDACMLIEEEISTSEDYAWMEGMPEPLPTGIENIVLTEKAKKVIVDGMIYIVRDGKLYNLTGAQVK